MPSRPQSAGFCVHTWSAWAKWRLKILGNFFPTHEPKLGRPSPGSSSFYRGLANLCPVSCGCSVAESWPLLEFGPSPKACILGMRRTGFAIGDWQGMARPNIDFLQNLLVGIASPGPWSELLAEASKTQSPAKNMMFPMNLTLPPSHPEDPLPDYCPGSCKAERGEPFRMGCLLSEIFPGPEYKSVVLLGWADMASGPRHLRVGDSQTQRSSRKGWSFSCIFCNSISSIHARDAQMQRRWLYSRVCQFRVLYTWRAWTHLKRWVQICGMTPFMSFQSTGQ